MNTRLNLAFLVALVSTIVVPSQARSSRPMVVDDLFSLQTLRDVRVSADGSSIAVVIQRAWSNPETFRPYTMLGGRSTTPGHRAARERTASRIPPAPADTAHCIGSVEQSGPRS